MRSINAIYERHFRFKGVKRLNVKGCELSDTETAYKRALEWPH